MYPFETALNYLRKARPDGRAENLDIFLLHALLFSAELPNSCALQNWLNLLIQRDSASQQFSHVALSQNRCPIVKIMVL